MADAGKRFEIVWPGVERTAPLSLAELGIHGEIASADLEEAGKLKPFESFDRPKFYVIRVKDWEGQTAPDTCCDMSGESDELYELRGLVDDLEQWITVRTDRVIAPKTPRNTVSTVLTHLESQRVQIERLKGVRNGEVQALRNQIVKLTAELAARKRDPDSNQPCRWCGALEGVTATGRCKKCGEPGK